MGSFICIARHAGKQYEKFSARPRQFALIEPKKGLLSWHAFIGDAAQARESHKFYHQDDKPVIVKCVCKAIKVHKDPSTQLKLPIESEKR